MIAVKDSMVIIHLAKTSLLETACSYFGNVIIPERIVWETVSRGMERGYGDALIIHTLIERKKIMVKKITDAALLRRAYQFNIQGGEAEAVALYWQEKADLLATDDDNVRKKRVTLEIQVIGTPAIILALYRKKMVTKEKIVDAINTLREIGWFSSAILDSMMMEVI